jgi:hypothetical protein
MSTQPRPFAFVLMPFAKSFDDAYHLAIKPACDSAGAYAERVDQQIFAGNIMDRVYNQIAKADLVIADMSDRNANVFYEVGYAHALGKTTVLMTQSEADIPFDLRQYPHIVYGDSLNNLKSELERRVRWHIENPRSSATASEELGIQLAGRELHAGDLVELQKRGEPGSIALRFAIQNRSERVVRSLAFRAGVFAPPDLDQAMDKDGREYESTFIGDGRIFKFPGQITLLPREWTTMEFRARRRAGGLVPGERLNFTLHLYFDSGALSVPFSVEVKRP